MYFVWMQYCLKIIIKKRLHFTLCFIPFTALATLKPQAGLVAPQAIPASQPAAAVSD